VTAAGQALSASRAKYVYYVPETDFVGTDTFAYTTTVDGLASAQSIA
jgi:hypothetical protein